MEFSAGNSGCVSMTLTGFYRKEIALRELLTVEAPAFVEKGFCVFAEAISFPGTRVGDHYPAFPVGIISYQRTGS